MPTHRELQRACLSNAKPKKRAKKTTTPAPKKRGRPPLAEPKARLTTSISVDARRLLRLINAHDPQGEGQHLSKMIEARAKKLGIS